MSESVGEVFKQAVIAKSMSNIISDLPPKQKDKILRDALEKALADIRWYDITTAVQREMLKHVVEYLKRADIQKNIKRKAEETVTIYFDAKLKNMARKIEEEFVKDWAFVFDEDEDEED